MKRKGEVFSWAEKFLKGFCLGGGNYFYNFALKAPNTKTHAAWTRRIDDWATHDILFLMEYSDCSASELFVRVWETGRRWV